MEDYIDGWKCYMSGIAATKVFKPGHIFSVDFMSGFSDSQKYYAGEKLVSEKPELNKFALHCIENGISIKCSDDFYENCFMLWIGENGYYLWEIESVRFYHTHTSPLKQNLCDWCGEQKQTGVLCVGDDECNYGPDGKATEACLGWSHMCCKCGADYARGQM